MKYEVVLALIILSNSFALPVKKNKSPETVESQPSGPAIESALEYERYLKEIVEALESDPEFRKRLDNAPEADIRSGKIAQELDYVNHHVRNKLDEIKRRELDRLRNLANKEYELSNSIDRTHLKIPHHLDHSNDQTFEIEDLRKLIQKTSEDLADADRQRRVEFKEYEMQKQFERDAKMRGMVDKDRKIYEEEIKKQQHKLKNHEKLHHPGNKAQLEEVWEKQDHLDKDEFDPHTFFMIHDVDSNSVWDETEVKALFVKELDKIYQAGLSENDTIERAEEMERMREHFFKETDTNRDGLISIDEFLKQTNQTEFNKDPGWETIDEQPQYTHEEYLEFERRRQEDIKRMANENLPQQNPHLTDEYHLNNAQNIHDYPQNSNGHNVHNEHKPSMNIPNEHSSLNSTNQHHESQLHSNNLNDNHPNVQQPQKN